MILIKMIKLAIEEINKLNGSMKYVVINGDKDSFLKIKVLESNSIIIKNLNNIQSVTFTKNSLSLFKNGTTTIIPPSICVYI